MISPLKKTIINLPIRLKGNSKRTSSNSLSLVAEGSNKDLGAVSQTLLARLRLRLRAKPWLGRPDGTFLEFPDSLSEKAAFQFLILLPPGQKLYKWTKQKHELESELIAEG